MQAIFSFLFLALQERICSIVHDDGRDKVFRYVNHDVGDLAEHIPPLSYPAVLIDMNNFSFTAMASNTQQAQGEVVLKVIYAAHTATSNLSPQRWREKGLGYYEAEDRLHRVLQGWRPEYLVEVSPADPDAEPPVEAVVKDVLEHCGGFDRVSAITDSAKAGLRIRTLTYSIAFEDFVTMPDVEYIPAPEFIF